MLCPVCKSVNLTMAERSGIEIDYCPQCRGVWLDRGELDKIIDRATPQMAAPAQHPPPPMHAPGSAPYVSSGHYRKKKREGFLGELFDFD